MHNFFSMPQKHEFSMFKFSLYRHAFDFVPIQIVWPAQFPVFMIDS